MLETITAVAILLLIVIVVGQSAMLNDKLLNATEDKEERENRESYIARLITQSKETEKDRSQLLLQLTDLTIENTKLKTKLKSCDEEKTKIRLAANALLGLLEDPKVAEEV